MEHTEEEKSGFLKEVAENLLSLIGVDVKVSVEFNKEDGVFIVNIGAGDFTGLLIGKRGETLLGIQTVLSLLFKQRTGEWNRVLVNIGDYREKEEEYLRSLATSTAQRVFETGEPQKLYNLKSWQRRVVHLVLSQDDRVETNSEGEGEDRCLIINSKKDKN